MKRGTLGTLLINSQLPSEYQVDGDFSMKKLKNNMISLAKKDPEKFSQYIPKLKKLGDEFATFETITVGLDDIEPEYAKKNAVINEAKSKLNALGNNKTARLGVLLQAQEKLLALTKEHPGNMGMQSRSGGRGNTNQLMKIVTSPGIVGDFDGAPIPYLIERGYAEGLSPAEAWIAGDESRTQTIKTQLGTAEPGEMQKVLASVMANQVIAEEDCGTKAGVRMSSDDPAIVGRYLVDGRLIDANLAGSLARSGGNVQVRSPLNCELDSGICKKCMGLDVVGKQYKIGANVGIRAGASLSEPLTQMALSSKHGVSLVMGDHNKPRGLAAFKQFVEVPETFFQRAPVATTGGRVTMIKKAPQGGFEVGVGNTVHYVPPNREIKVKQGDTVEQGDLLASGIPAPDDVVKYKGMGFGREYLVKSLRDTYTESGIEVDPRHLELLARSQLNYAQVLGGVPGVTPGEIVLLQTIRKNLMDTGKEQDISSAVGKTLTSYAGVHTPGTKLTSSVVNDLRSNGITRVQATDSNPEIKPVMVAATRTPLLNPNWLQRLGYRYQKQTMIDAATFGQKADLHSHDPVPALALGVELRRDDKGRY
jgi:DNA-directed RNA polymerase subunit beta'